ncbi:MAG: hypothetical protein ACYCVH_04870, partial [Ignavibacteriaceae bacterium]
LLLFYLGKTLSFISSESSAVFGANQIIKEHFSLSCRSAASFNNLLYMRLMVRLYFLLANSIFYIYKSI